MVKKSAQQDRLHLGVLSPPRQAIFFLSGDDRTDMDELAWDLPDGSAVDDSVLHVINAPTPAIIQLDLIIEDPSAYDGVGFDFIRSYPQGVSMVAVERRLGHPLPQPPGTIDPGSVDAVLRAVEAEDENPTPWRELVEDNCRTADQFDQSYPAYGCPVCDDPDVGLEWHRIEWVEGDSDHSGSLIAVCSSCHDRFHAPVVPALADLLGEGRPPCPSCSVEHTSHVIWGFPPGPPPPGFQVAGCVIGAINPEYECGDCGLQWTEDDSHYQLVPDPLPQTHLRARVAGTVPRFDLEHPRLRANGRLVMGRAAHDYGDSVTAAWSSEVPTVTLIGDDRKIYNVDPRTVRLTEPREPHDHPHGEHVIVDHAAAVLFEALAADPGEVTLSSPFLTLPVAMTLSDLARNSAHDWYLLTRLDPGAAAHGFLSVRGLRLLLDAGVMIGDCRGLHAKAYVAGDAFAMIGSANLTTAGLGQSATPNSELSVTVPPSEVRRVQEILDGWWELGRDVGKRELDTLERLAAELPHPAGPTTSGGQGGVAPGVSDVSAVVEQLISEARAEGIGLWVKALDGTPDPEDWTSGGWFSSSKKGRPSFDVGDLVFLYSKEQHGVVGVVEVLDQPQFDPGFVSSQIGGEEGDRWPWVNRATPRFLPNALVVVPGEELGIKTQGLQGGHLRVHLSDFAAGVQALAEGYRVAAADGESGFLV